MIIGILLFCIRVNHSLFCQQICEIYSFIPSLCVFVCLIVFIKQTQAHQFLAKKLNAV